MHERSQIAIWDHFLKSSGHYLLYTVNSNTFQSSSHHGELAKNPSLLSVPYFSYRGCMCHVLDLKTKWRGGGGGGKEEGWGGKNHTWQSAHLRGAGFWTIDQFLFH